MTKDLPTGTITFLFTDIEASTRLLSRVGSVRYAALLDRHHRIVRDSLDRHRGLEMRTEGDAFFAVFERASAAVDAAVDIQRALGDEPELAKEAMAVRMGLHSGPATIGGDNYTGIDVHIAARVSAAAHGGQILVSDRVAESAAGADASFKPLGEYWLKDIDEPVGINQVLATGLRSETPLPHAPSTHPTNAPIDLSSFVGREIDMDRGVDALLASRLVTLTGPGGTGKTRLAIEIGAVLSREYPDGTFFVALAGTDDPDSVPDRTADAVGAPMTDPTIPPIEALCDHLRHRSALLIMDNFEQVLAGASHVASLLDASPGTTVLATSRTPLGLSGEHELVVAPLDVSKAGVELFAERARAVLSSFTVDDSNRATVEAIVGRLDGLPLAIELAAARIRMMSCDAILATLDPLTLAGRSSSNREVTLADTIRWSFDLLAEPEQVLLTRLGVFPTGAGLSEIEAVVRPREDLGMDLFTGLGALVDHSLLVGDTHGAAPRFRMLETVREFAIGRLREAPDEREIRDRHAQAYTDLLETARPHLDGPDSATWMATLGTENANLQAAFSHAIDVGDATTAQRIVSAAWRFWQARGHLAEGTRAATAALALEASDPTIKAGALDAAGSIAYWSGDTVATRMYYDDAVRLREENAISRGLANALYNLSFPVSDQDGREAAITVLNRAIEAAGEDGDHRTKALAFTAIARSWLEDDPRQALEYSERALEAATSIGDPVSEAWMHTVRAAALHHVDDHLTSTAELRTALVVFREFDDLSGIAVAMTGIADNADRLGDDAMAGYTAGAVLSLREETGIGVSTVLDATVSHFDDPAVVEALTPRLRESFESGRHDALDVAVDTVLEYEPTPPES